jgi:hypothetical protein
LKFFASAAPVEAVTMRHKSALPFDGTKMAPKVGDIYRQPVDEKN